VQDRRCQIKAAAIGIARNGQYAGSQRETPPQNRRSAENYHSAKNRHTTENAAAVNAGEEMAVRSVGPAAADWTETEAEIAERNNDTEMETSGTAPPMTS
jgi:hypothetical protein